VKSGQFGDVHNTAGYELDEYFVPGEKLKAE
jgi:hypothetical protein